MPRYLAWIFVFISICLGQGAHAATFTDAAGRTVTLPTSVRKVAAAGPPAEAMIYAVAPEKLAGWVNAKSTAEKDFMATSVAGLSVLGRLTGAGGVASVAAIAKAKPDLIIDVGDVTPAYAALADRVQKETGIPYVLIDGRLARTGEALRQVGSLLDASFRADKLAAYSDNLRQDLSEAVAQLPKTGRTRIYYARGADGLESGMSGSLTTEFIEAVGAVNVVDKGGRNGMAEVTVKEVADWNPDIIIAEDPGFFATIRKDPAWASVKAVQEGKVYLPPFLPYGWLGSPPSINRLMGISWLAGLLYPDRFDKDQAPRAMDFYSEFYQVDIFSEEIEELFKGTSLQN